VPSGEDLDRILAACDDVVLSHEAAGDLATFDRDAPTFAAAVGSALADLERAVPAGRVLRVEAVPPAGQPGSPRPADPGRREARAPRPSGTGLGLTS
jgi:hypothetical protein